MLPICWIRQKQHTLLMASAVLVVAVQRLACSHHTQPSRYALFCMLPSATSIFIGCWLSVVLMCDSVPSVGPWTPIWVVKQKIVHEEASRMTMMVQKFTACLIDHENKYYLFNLTLSSLAQRNLGFPLSPQIRCGIANSQSRNRRSGSLQTHILLPVLYPAHCRFLC